MQLVLELFSYFVIHLIVCFKAKGVKKTQFSFFPFRRELMKAIWNEKKEQTEREIIMLIDMRSQNGGGGELIDR